MWFNKINLGSLSFNRILRIFLNRERLLIFVTICIFNTTKADETANPQDLHEKQEFIKALNDCLSELSGRLASVFILREIIGETTEEICKVLDITATNCCVILYRARMYLRRCLEVGWFKPDIS